MKKSNSVGDSRLNDIENESRDQLKVSGSKKDSSIRSDEEPLPADGGPRIRKEDVQNQQQDEFIDRQNNSKEEG